MNQSQRPGQQWWLARLLFVTGSLLPQTRVVKLTLWLAFVLIRFWLRRRNYFSNHHSRNKSPWN